MAASKLAAILLTKRAELKDIVQTEMLALGRGTLSTPSAPDACIALLIEHPNVVLVLDWALGSEAVNLVLGAIRGHFHIETRPVLLVIPEVNENVIATATEYGVSQAHAGDVTNETIKACLDALLNEDVTTGEVRAGLIQVATAREKGDWTIATPILQELWAKHQGNDRVAVELAENLIYEERWDEAIVLLTPFTETEPPHIRALHLVGRCKMHQGDYDGAIKLLERAKIINPHNVERLIDLGHAFLQNDQVDKAMLHFNEALTLDEENKSATIGKGQCLLMAGEVNEALALLKAISGPRELASIFNTAAVLAMRQGRHDQGMQLYKSAVQAIGRNDKVAARLMFNMGIGYKRWQKPDKANACFQRAVELDPTFVKAINHKNKTSKEDIDGLAEESIGSKPVVSSSSLEDDSVPASGAGDVDPLDE